MTIPSIALLGRKDEPTDAVEEYCRYLADALQAHDIQLEIRRVPWEVHGWPGALHAVRLQATRWRDTWVLVQYTALGWSARGFPQKVLRALKILKSAGARVGIVFHDVEPYSGTRLIDSVRRFVQVRTMRRALALADLAIFTVPLYKLSWLPFRPAPVTYTDPTAPPPTKLSPRTLDLAKESLSPAVFKLISQHQARLGAPVDPFPLLPRCHFIPVGPNLPIPFELKLPPHLVEINRRVNERIDRAKGLLPPLDAEEPPPPLQPPADHVRTVGVFSITGGEAGAKETQDILRAMRHASQKLGRLRLSVFGRHAELREAQLRVGLHDLPVEISVEGVLSDQQVVERLRTCDVLLFIRGGISTRRSSAIAGIACGVPMVAYVGSETSWPFQDAGVILVSPKDPEELNDALVLLLSDYEFRAGLALANYMTYNEHFSWSAIATRFAALLKSR